MSRLTHVQQSEFKKATLGDRSGGTETCSLKEKKEKDGKRTEKKKDKEVLDKNKIRETEDRREQRGSRRMHVE